MVRPVDTIVAVATGQAAHAAIGIVRLSGPQSWALLQALTGSNTLPSPRRVARVTLRDGQGQTIDEGLAVGFRQPASYTGEDAVELQMHGNPLLLERICRRCVELGARRAEPGEFSQRAYLNGKLDLAQAEAVADLISAASEDAARAAQSSLQGVFSQQCAALTEQILLLRVEIEAWLDFPEEDLGSAQRDQWSTRGAQIQQKLAQLLADAEQGCRLTQGLTVLLVGAPNAGKSTLLNALARREVAIVSDIQGTTRDLIRESVVLNGVPIQLIDSAGLRESTDRIEQMGVARANEAATQVDRILALDAPDAPLPPIPDHWLPRLLKVRTKCDLEPDSTATDDATLRVSAQTGQGLDALAAALSGRQPQSSVFSARQRHLDALQQAQRAIQAAQQLLQGQAELELPAEELRLAQQALGEITGEVSTEDLLGRIFSSFCIGK